MLKTLPDVREEIETLRQEVQTSKDHMVQVLIAFNGVQMHSTI